MCYQENAFAIAALCGDSKVVLHDDGSVSVNGKKAIIPMASFGQGSNLRTVDKMPAILNVTDPKLPQQQQPAPPVLMDIRR